MDNNPRPDSFCDKLVEFGGHHVSTAAIFLGGATISALASLFADDIRSSFPFQSCFNNLCSNINFAALAFWLVIILVLPLAVLQAVSLYRERARSTAILEQSSETLDNVESGLNDGVERLQELIRTMPPRHFLAHLALCSSRAFVFRDQLLATADDTGAIQNQNIEFAIRQILFQVIWLAQYWDTHSTEPRDGVVYRGNIMLFKEAELYAEKASFSELIAKLRFVDLGLIERLQTSTMFDGYLEVIPELSTHTGTKEADIDVDIKPLALAVNLKRSAEDCPSRLVQGAPHAMFYQKAQWIEDTRVIADQSQEDPFLAPLIDEIRAYYEGDVCSNSILSIPLPPPVWHQTMGERDDGYTGKDTYVGVLNIYRNQASIVKDRERSEQFTNLMTPLCILATELAGMYQLTRE